MSMKRRLFFPLLCLALAAACGPRTPGSDQQVRLAVEQTLSALPANTPLPPTPIAPTSTAVSLSGLFCEYEFCIGHPSDAAFYDVSAAQNQLAPSTYSQGDLATYSSSLFIQMMWQEAPSASDPQFMLDLIVRYDGAIPGGSVEPKLSGDLNVYYETVTPSPGAASKVPYGAAAAWLCGNRAFAWKTYTQQPALPPTLLAEALMRFRCDSR
jgi:hypothetical protein